MTPRYVIRPSLPRCQPPHPPPGPHRAPGVRAVHVVARRGVRERPERELAVMREAEEADDAARARGQEREHEVEHAVACARISTRTRPGSRRRAPNAVPLRMRSSSGPSSPPNTLATGDAGALGASRDEPQRPKKPVGRVAVSGVAGSERFASLDIGTARFVIDGWREGAREPGASFGRPLGNTVLKSLQIMPVSDSGAEGGCVHTLQTWNVRLIGS
jgi:hypothetical protein